MVESELESPLSPLADLLSRVIHGEPIPRSTLEQMAATAVSSFIGRRITVDELKRDGAKMGVNFDDINLSWDDVRVRAGEFYSRASSRVRGGDPEAARARAEERAQKQREREAQRQANAKSREQASHVSRARRILGYSAKEPVTKEQVKQRQRELARKHHPDRGGDVSRMQDINWAVDILLGPG